MEAVLERFSAANNSSQAKDTLEVREDSLFEVYEHFYGNVTLLDSDPRARVGTNIAPCRPPDFCVQTFSASRWIHISGRLLERSAFAVVFPEDSHARPVVLTFSQEPELDSNKHYDVRTDVQRIEPYVIGKNGVNFILLFDTPIRYITTSPGMSLTRNFNGLSIYWPKESDHGGSEQWFYASGRMQKSALRLSVRHWQSARNTVTKDLIFKPSHSNCTQANFSYIRRVFFQPSHARAFKLTSISGSPPPPPYVIPIPVESYASTCGDIALEFGFRMRSLRSRGDDLFRELETKCRQNLLIVESCGPCDRSQIFVHVREQLKTCDKLGLEQAIAHYGCLEQKEVTCFEDLNLPSCENVPPCHAPVGNFAKYFAAPFENHGNRLKPKSISGNTDSESFEMLECSPSSNCSYSCSPSDKPEVLRTETQASLFSGFNISSWLLDARSPSSKCEKDDRVFPTIVANPSFWLCAERVGNERTKGNSIDDDLVLKHEKDRKTEDIESTPLVRCQSVNGEPLCKRLGGCALQLASDAIRMSTKPGPNVNRLNSDASNASVVISQLRKIGATDDNMWLSTKSCYGAVSNSSSERVLLGDYDNQNDDWKDKWLQKSPDSVAVDHLDLQAAKKNKLANLLLDNRENIEANLEAILYRSPFIDRTSNWLQVNWL
ncbi:hypothetical protein TcWFU_006756 [Taenia crassiceps]|uniref:Uncharacterized protein n=1 Tax=Taenia crassiceps TaxID=6207 RepID=A0ABR4Q064_9CEST